MQRLHFMNAVEMVRIFPDREDATAPYAKTFLAGMDDGHIEHEIDRAKVEGCGVFFNVNQTDHLGGSAENITKVRTFFIDFDQYDDSILLDLMTSRCPPSAIVETVNGYHAYWFAKPGEPVDREWFSRVELGLMDRFGGDRSVKDIARVLRLPGSYHVKGDPKLVRIIHQLPDPPHYSGRELLECYPYDQPKRPPLVREHQPKNWNRVVAAMSHWEPIPGSRNRCLLMAAGVAYGMKVDKHTFCDTITDIAESWGTGRDMQREVKRVADWVYNKRAVFPMSSLLNLGVKVNEF